MIELGFGDDGKAVFMNYNETAEFLGCSRYTVRNLVKRGELDSVKVGRCRYVSRHQAEQWLQSRLAPLDDRFFAYVSETESDTEEE